MSPRAIDRLVRSIVAAATAGVLLSGCSDIYFDRRETLTFHAGDAVATNIAIQTIDPWPKVAGIRNIEHDGTRMQKAAERYRTGKTTPLATTSTSSVQYQPVLAPPAAAAPGGTP